MSNLRRYLWLLLAPLALISFLIPAIVVPDKSEMPSSRGLPETSGPGQAPRAASSEQSPPRIEENGKIAWPPHPDKVPLGKVHFRGDEAIKLKPINYFSPIHSPRYLPADRAPISPDSPVIGITDGKEARAYSHYLLDVHEIVQDEMGGGPIVVTW